MEIKSFGYSIVKDRSLSLISQRQNGEILVSLTISLVLALLSFINEQYRLVAAMIFTGAIVFYIIYSFSDDVDEHEERIKKLEEKLKIHENIAYLKSDVEHLKKEVFKK